MAQEQAIKAELNNIYVYNDKGCDCATENLAVEHYISDNITSINEVKQCAASCCGDEGVLLKKYEPTENILT